MENKQAAEGRQSPPAIPPAGWAGPGGGLAPRMVPAVRTARLQPGQGQGQCWHRGWHRAATLCRLLLECAELSSLGPVKGKAAKNRPCSFSQKPKEPWGPVPGLWTWLLHGSTSMLSSQGLIFPDAGSASPPPRLAKEPQPPGPPAGFCVSTLPRRTSVSLGSQV